MKTSDEMLVELNNMSNLERNKFLDKLYELYFHIPIPREIIEEEIRILEAYYDGELTECDEKYSVMKSTIKKGDIYLCYEGKQARPVVFVNDKLIKVDIDIIAKVTDKEVHNEFDVIIDKWEYSGLSNVSVVRCSKITYVNHRNLIRKIGSLHEDDLKKVMNSIKAYFDF